MYLPASPTRWPRRGMPEGRGPRATALASLLTLACTLLDPAGVTAQPKRKRPPTVGTALPGGSNQAPSTPGPVATAARAHVLGRVVSRDGERVTIDRGSRDGLRADEAGLVFHPLRTRAGETARVIDSLVILASGTVLELGPDTAVVRLERNTGEVRVGDLAGYRISLPQALEEDALTRVALRSVKLQALSPKAPLYGLADRLTAPNAGAATATLERLVAEIQARVSLADAAYKGKTIPEGRFHGLSLSDAFRRTTARDVEDFLWFVDGFPGKYVGQDWILVEVYATWIINRTPSGEAERMTRKLQPLLATAERQCTAGDMERCEASLREALRQWPELAEARTRLQSIDAIEATQRELKRAPDQHDKRYSMMAKYAGLKAWPHVIAQADLLIAANQMPTNSRFWRAVALGEQGKLDIALAELVPLQASTEGKPLHGSIVKRIRLLEARKAAGGRPVSSYTFADWMKEAATLEASGEAEEAQQKLTMARSVAQTAAELTEVAAASERIVVMRDLLAQCSSIQSNARTHDHSRINERIATVVKLAREAGTSAPNVAVKAAACLDKASDEARGVDEFGLAVALSEAALSVQPNDANLARSAAWNAWIARDMARADRWTLRAVELDPKQSFAQHMRGLVLLARGDLDGAEQASLRAAESPTYAWPHTSLAKIALLRGDIPRAVAESKIALTLAPEEQLLQHNLHHALRIQTATAELAAAPADATPERAIVLARTRLRLLRSATWFELWPLVERDLTALRGTGAYDDACRAVAEVVDRSAPLELRMRAVLAAEPTTARHHMLRDRIAAEAAVAAEKGAGAERARTRLAALLVREGRFHLALATLGGLTQAAASPDIERAAANASEAARRGLRGNELLTQAQDARARSGAGAEAERFYAAALPEFEAIECWSQAATTAFWLAVTQAAQGRVEQALQAMEAAQKRIARYLDPLQALDLDHIQGGLLSWRGNLEAASQAVERSIAVCAAYDDDLCVQGMRIRGAASWIDGGRLSDAHREVADVLAFARDRSLGSLVRQALFQLAEVALVRGDLPQTNALAAELLPLARKAKDDNNERLALMLHGAVAMRRGDAPTALGYFADVLRVGVRMGDAGIQAMARLFEGMTQLDAAHDDKAALPAFAAASALSQSVGDDYGAARARSGQARAEHGLGKFDDARTRLQAVLAYAEGAGRRVMIASSHIELGHIELSAKRPAVAQTHAERATAIVESMDIGSQRAAALHVLGLALTANARRDEGIERLKQAAKINAEEIARTGGDSEQQGATGYGRSRRIFRDAIDALLAAGRAEEALEMLQLSRDAALQRTFGKLRPKVQDQTAQRAVESAQDAKEQELAARRALEAEKAKPDTERSEARLKALGEKIAGSEAKARQLLFQLKKDHPRLHALSAQVTDPGALLRGRKALPDGTVVLATFAAENELFLFTIAKERDRVQAYRVPVGAAELRADVLAWRQAVQKRTPKQSALGRKLYERLLGPVEADLASAKTVLVVPSGPLFYLPFGALEPPPGKHRYAIERWRFGTIVSETIVTLQSAAIQRKWSSFAAFTNPDGSLPGAQAEVEKLASDVLRGAKIFLGERVVADSIRSVIGQARVLHFATHGVLAGNGPDSFLQLAGTKLTLDDIAGLDLVDQVDLVVLSACQTAVAVGETAEEGFSIADTFSRAGVPTLIASLWAVPDDATGELMVRFYRNLRGGKISGAEALQRAQVELIGLQQGGRKPYANPVHWAAFGLLGDPR